MKAAICTKYGKPEVLEIQEIPKPIAKPDQVLVKIIATAVNSGDIRVRALAVLGLLKVIMRIVLGFTKPRKPILGTVYAGIIESIGSKVTAFKPGDKVFGMTGFGFGTYAEYISIKESDTISLMPHNASFEEATAIIFGGQTALYFLEKAKLSKKLNSSILIIGSTGSVGVAAIQIAKAFGANITAVCSSAGYNLTRQLGIVNIIQYDKEDYTKCNQKFDIIFDAAGKNPAKQCKPLLTKGGIYLTVGGLDYATETKTQLLQLKHLFEAGNYKAVIDKIYSLNEIVAAHEYVETGRKKGNVVITISGI